MEVKCMRMVQDMLDVLGIKIRENRLRWFGHIQRRYSEYTGRRTLKLGTTSRRPGGRPNRRFKDVGKEDIRWKG